MLGFGGVAALARHIVVVERGWMTEVEFAELFGVASSLPGANTVNLATMLGDRQAGLSGACAALCGLLGAPMLILILVALFYARFSGLPDVKAGFIGAAAATAGLVFGTALRLLRNLKADWLMLLVIAAVFAATAVAQLSMLFVLALAIPACLVLVILRERGR